MKLSAEQVRHVAKLARLHLSGAEVERYQTQLSAVLDAVAAMDALDTTDVPPTSHAHFAESLRRPDEPVPSLPVEEGLANAPKRSHGSFAVPQILE